MNLDAAQTLVRELGRELGGVGGEYEMDARGEAFLVLDDNLPVLIRHVEAVVVVAVIVARDVDDRDPSLFGTLMDYQFMGLRTNGFGLSWNPSTECLQLAAHLRGEPDVKDLADLLSTLLVTGLEVRDELATLMAYRKSLLEGMADQAEEQPLAPTAAVPTSGYASIRG